jgi:putative peptidoglycan lipid II flippase
MAHVVSTFGLSVAQQIVGLARQMLIAAWFGVSREYDQYIVVYAMAVITVFNLSTVFDTVAVSRLVKIREAESDEAFWRSSNRLFLQSLVGGLIFAAGLYLAVRVLLPVIAAGFDEAERASLSQLALCFMPWIAIIVPYYAVSAHLKALWRFHWVFGAEIVAIVVSAIALWFWHDSIESLPAVYFIGYLTAFMILCGRRGIRLVSNASRPNGFLAGMANQHLANQLGSATGLVDRYFQSYLESGGISALGYANQIVSNLSSLMTFREIYVVPLTPAAGRSERLEKMLQGVVLISIPCAFFVAEFAEPIVVVLFQRGHFTPEAAALTAGPLRILALSLAISSLLAPMARLFQIVDRISYSHLLYLVSLLCSLVFQYFLVFRMGWGVHGVAWAALANSAVTTLVVAALVRHCGVVVNWFQVFTQALFAAAVGSAAVAISLPCVMRLDGLAALLLGGSLFALFVAASYFVARARLLPIIG